MIDDMYFTLDCLAHPWVGSVCRDYLSRPSHALIRAYLEVKDATGRRAMRPTGQNGGAENQRALPRNQSRTSRYATQSVAMQVGATFREVIASRFPTRRELPYPAPIISLPSFEASLP
jgi:hypothetical protein